MNCRAVIYGFHAPELVPAVRAGLQGIGEVVHWIGVNRDGQSFDEDIVAWHLGEQLSLPSLESARQRSREAAKAITEQNFAQIADQLKRNPFCAEMSPDQIRLLAQRLFVKFDALLSDKQVNLVIFQNLPHEGFELLLYFAARNRRVRTVLCYQSILPNRFFHCESLDDFGFFRSCELEPAEPFVIERQFEKRLFYMKDLESKSAVSSANTSTTTRHPMKQRWRRLVTKLKQKTGYYRLRCKQPMAVDPQVEYESNLQNAIIKTASINAPFVYFPLHLQPELTTSAIGDEYSDQLRAIEELANWLPSSVAIFAKENPKQTHRWRDTEFFRRLQKIPRLKLVPTETSTYQLLRDCLYAATITGTVGWESISGGKPVLVFGRPWYLTLPGVFHFRDQPVFENIVNCKFSHAEFCNAVSELLRKSRPGIVDINYRRSLPDFDPEANSRAIAEFLRCQVAKTLALIE
ncbi:MAG: hypothetical protein ABL888_13520 [Pirellulaceae bacterium]